MYNAPRGTTDILPEEQAYWRYIEEKAADVCQLYGYERIETPVFEDTRLFTRGVGEGTDIVEKEMYTFDDRGSNSITLKPEGTASVCRAYLEHGFQNLPQPVNLIIFPRFSATSGRRQAGSANTISSAAKPSAKRTHFWTRKLSIWPGNF